ncbi:MAG TPA: polysaccharide biosynthesis tyrosine autokinase [Actinomycetota bacterium]|nr:polysaccharide biosynthesis tyrosine autokinase [Actinomycetota bacterium]
MGMSPRADVPPGTVDLREFVGTVLGRKWLVLATTALFAGLAALYSFTRVPTYTATASLLVRPILTSPLESNQLDRLSMDTEMGILASAAVADRARELLDAPLRVQDLLARVVVRAPENTQILEISFSDPDPDRARQGAQAFADAYLAFKAEQALATITRYSSTLQDRIAELEAEIEDLERRIADLPEDAAERGALVDERNALETSRLALQNQFVTIATLSTDPGEILQPAERPRVPSSPKHELNLALGVLLGAVVGVGLAGASERVGDRIRNPAVLEAYLDAPALGLIPRVSSFRGRAPLAPISEPRSAAAEAYRTLRTNLLAVSRHPEVRTVLVTGAEAGEGKSTVAANLAAALALAGRSVALISGDLRYPRVHAFFGIGNEHGLAQVLAGALPLAEAIRDTSIPNLKVLPSGPVVGLDEPVELLHSERMRQVIEGCRDADFVIVDGPPILAVADSLVLAELVDGIVFVTDARVGTRAAVAQARHQLRQVGARVLGGVLNRVEGWRRFAPYGAHDYRRSLLYRLLLPQGDDDRGPAAPAPAPVRQPAGPRSSRRT